MLVLHFFLCFVSISSITFFFINMCCKIVFQSIVCLLILRAILLLEEVIYRGCDSQLTPELEPGKWQLEAHCLLPIFRILAAGATQDKLHISFLCLFKLPSINLVFYPSLPSLYGSQAF